MQDILEKHRYSLHIFRYKSNNIYLCNIKNKNSINN